MNSTKFIPVWYKEHVEKLKIRKVYILMVITLSFIMVLYKGQESYKKELKNIMSM